MDRTGSTRTELSILRVRGQKGRLSSHCTVIIRATVHTHTGKHLFFFLLATLGRIWKVSLLLGLKRMYDTQMLRP